jgi:hypothetical protein
MEISDIYGCVSYLWHISCQYYYCKKDGKAKKFKIFKSKNEPPSPKLKNKTKTKTTKTKLKTKTQHMVCNIELKGVKTLIHES